MELRRIEVTGFGCLGQERLDFESGRANLILARNEAGKSTLLAAIEVALYGWPSARLVEGRELRRKFRPWAGGPSRVRLDLHAGGHEYRVEQDLLDGAGNDIEQAAVFRDEQDVTDEMRAEAGTPGLWLLGLSRDDFRRSVLVRQGELELVARETEQLVKHLESVVTSAEAGASATMAQQRLGEALEDYRARAGLEAWAQTYLSRAKEWSRVESRLEREIEDRREARRELDAKRNTIERDVAALDAADARLGALRRARECLRVLERAVRCRDLRRQIAADEDVRRQIAACEERIASLEDVRAFPAERADELVRLIEREAQARRGWTDAQAAVDRAQEAVRAAEAERTALAGVAPLADRAEGLVAQQALFARALDEAATARAQLRQEARALVEAGVPLERLEEARQRYEGLEFEERQTVLRLDKSLSDFEVALREQEWRLEQTRAELAQIDARRHRQRRKWILVAAAAVVLGTAACLFSLLVVGATIGAVVAGVIGATVIAYGTVRAARAGMLGADRRAALRAEIESVQIAQQEHAENRQRLRERVAGLAARQGLHADALVAAVRDYSEHRDRLDAHGQVQHKAQAADERVAQQRRQWASWLGQAGRGREPEAVEPADTAALVAQVKRFVELGETVARRRQNLCEAERVLAERRRALAETHEALRALLAAAHVPLPAMQADELLAAEELVAARRDFEARRTRHRDRQAAIAERDGLRRREIGEDDRGALRLRGERAAGELAEIEAAAGGTAAALAWLQADERPDVCAGCAAWTIDALTNEALTDMQERVSGAIEAAQHAHARTWQDTRAFLNDYARRRRALDDELAQLAAELERGRRFAAAVLKARTMLANVQASSYERWSELLRAKLVPLLDVVLPEYRLECVGADLSPILVHRPTLARLPLDAIQLHLSRGAKDRLFLALRLALADVLGEQRGVRLPLLLDDPLANWDDESLVDGLALLCRLGAREATLAVFTCQRSRCEAAVARGARRDAPALRGLAGNAAPPERPC